MNTESLLKERSSAKCEICESTSRLHIYEIQPSDKITTETCAYICDTCQTQLENPESMDAGHWRCLSKSMWSEFIPVQVLSYRALSLLKNETWAQDLLGQMYLDEESLQWAQSGLPSTNSNEQETKTLDSNGTQLLEGDSVTLIKDLEVKGANFTAKRGTLVKSITLTNNPLHIEGRVNGTTIVLVAKFLKKA